MSWKQISYQFTIPSHKTAMNTCFKSHNRFQLYLKKNTFSNLKNGKKNLWQMSDVLYMIQNEKQHYHDNNWKFFINPLYHPQMWSKFKFSEFFERYCMSGAFKMVNQLRFFLFLEELDQDKLFPGKNFIMSLITADYNTSK